MNTNYVGYHLFLLNEDLEQFAHAVFQWINSSHLDNIQWYANEEDM